MARGRYRRTGPLSSLRQLVAFAEAERDTPPALRAAIRQADPLLRALLPPVAQAVRAVVPEQVPRVQQDLRLFLRVLCNHPATRQALVGLPVRATLTPLAGGSRAGRPVLGWRLAFGRHPETPAEAGHALRFHAAWLLLAVGQDRLQFCPAPHCGGEQGPRLFVKVGARQYCSTRCQRRATYRPIPTRSRRKDRHGTPTTRKRRRQHH